MNEPLNEKKHLFWFSLLGKAIITIFYSLLLVLFLYLPSIISLFNPAKNELNICVFSEMLSSEAIAEFEKKYNVHVNITNFELDEELYVKFRINQGEGYDIVIVSEYIIPQLIKHDYLEPIDKKLITHADDLDPRLLNRNFDPENRFSIPVMWLSYGLLYDTAFFKNIPMWDTIYKNPELLVRNGTVAEPFRVCILGEPRDLILLTAAYLFREMRPFSNEDLRKILAVLIEQKKWVECYTTASLQYFILSGVVPIAMAASNHAKRIMEISQDFNYVIPEEGSTFAIESLAIPRKSNRKELAHTFINFMISRESSYLHAAEFAHCPANKYVYDVLRSTDDFYKKFFPSEADFNRLYLPGEVIDREKVENVWIELSFK